MCGCGLNVCWLFQEKKKEIYYTISNKSNALNWNDFLSLTYTHALVHSNVDQPKLAIHVWSNNRSFLAVNWYEKKIASYHKRAYRINFYISRKNQQQQQQKTQNIRKKVTHCDSDLNESVMVQTNRERMKKIETLSAIKRARLHICITPNAYPFGHSVSSICVSIII